MVSPNLITKTEYLPTMDGQSKKLFQLIFGQKKKAQEGKQDNESPKIHVSQLVSQLSLAYEKIRNAVDYEDEHLLRKNAIKRIIKRHLVIEGAMKDYDSEEISRHLLTELIQAKYLPNDRVPEIKIKEVADILEKYVELKILVKKQFRSAMEMSSREAKEKAKVINWLIALAAVEIENNLNVDEVKQLVVSNMFEVLSRSITLPVDLPYQKDLPLQIYLGIARNYLRLDQDMLGYVVFKYYNNWEKVSEEEMKNIAKNFRALYDTKEKQLKHPLNKQMDKVVRRYSLYYSMLVEVIEENPVRAYEQAISNPKLFTTAIKDHCERKYKKVKSRLWKSGLRSIIYIFLTKSVFAVAIEVPAIKFFGEPMNYFALAINIGFPALLLFIMILFTKTPDSKNTEKIIDGIKEIVYTDSRRTQPIALRLAGKRGYFINIIFNFIYGVAFLLTVYFLVKLLDQFSFTWISIAIFLFFLVFVSFFSFRVKHEVKRYVITEDKENIFSFVFDFFFMPIVAMGKFLSDNVSKINVFVFVLDFIIEAPFKIIVAVIEDWTKYLKEKKEDLT